MSDLLPRQVANAVPPELSSGDQISSLATWLLHEGRSEPDVRQWLNFLASLYAQFRIVQDLFPRANPGRSGEKDETGVLTNPDEMLAIANQLLILRSHDVEGCVLECGCFKGYSSCCLSIACRRLGYPFVIADSFAGLPPLPNDPGQSDEVDVLGRVYNPGDFAGSRAEVERNLRSLGSLEGVEFFEGWFSETLKDWHRPLALLWLDVDLWSSTMDVLKPCLPALDPRGCIFSHEFARADIKDSKIIRTSGVPGAFARVMQEDDPDYEAEYLRGNTGIVGRHSSIGIRAFQLLNEMMPSLGLIGLPWYDIPRSRLERLAITVTRFVNVFRKPA
jgi:hypothetical protein